MLLPSFSMGGWSPAAPGTAITHHGSLEGRENDRPELLLVVFNSTIMEIPQTEELGDLDLEKAEQKKGSWTFSGSWKMIAQNRSWLFSIAQ